MKTTLDEMQAFLTVVDSGSITAAAEQLGQTISATSRTLSRLEEKLKTTLMRRTTRRMELTEEGGAFLEQARNIIANVEAAEESMAARRSMPAGQLRVDAASPFMLHVIVPLVAGYRARYPQVALELNSSEGIIDLLERRTDVAIRIGRLKDSTLHATPIGSSRIRVLASPACLAAHGSARSVYQIGLGRHACRLRYSEALKNSQQLIAGYGWKVPGRDNRRTSRISVTGLRIRKLLTLSERVLTETVIAPPTTTPRITRPKTMPPVVISGLSLKISATAASAVRLRQMGGAA